MKELNWKNLCITGRGTIHIDNYTAQIYGYKTWCGIGISGSPVTYGLKKQYKPSNIKLCKKCSKVYYKEYKELFVTYIIILKLKDKLFI